MATAKNLPCKSLKDLDKVSKDCEDNHHYLRAGTQCLSVFEDRMKNQLKISVRDLDQKAVDKMDKPTKKKVLLQLDFLRSQIKAYRDNIYYPEGWDEAEETLGGDRTKYINSHKCYSEANEGLMEVEYKANQIARLLTNKKKNKKK
ncbi:MAG: hypothetical protein KDD33_03545 [Bdellovibrionales bacterium]|nr:hypothetical protein [Bdellovibrionales bacterium]